MKAFADDKLDVAKKIISVHGWVESIVGEKKKCWSPAFSLFSTMSSKAFPLRGRRNFGLFVAQLTLYHTIPTFNNPIEEGFGKHCGKRKKCWLLAFFLFPPVFSTLSRREITILATFNLSSANSFNLVQSKKNL